VQLGALSNGDVVQFVFSFVCLSPKTKQHTTYKVDNTGDVTQKSKKDRVLLESTVVGQFFYLGDILVVCELQQHDEFICVRLTVMKLFV